MNSQFCLMWVIIYESDCFAPDMLQEPVNLILKCNVWNTVQDVSTENVIKKFFFFNLKTNFYWADPNRSFSQHHMVMFYCLLCPLLKKELFIIPYSWWPNETRFEFPNLKWDLLTSDLDCRLLLIDLFHHLQQLGNSRILSGQATSLLLASQTFSSHS